jgi:sugar phosphate isomerase/epimerase
MKICCQEQLLPGETLAAKWDAAREAGFDGIELRARGEGHFAGRLAELRAAARSGVVMPTVCPDTDHFIGDFDPARRRDAVVQLRSQLSVTAEIGGEGVLTPASWGMFSLRLPPFTPPRKPAEDHAVLLEALVELAEHAAREGVSLFVEPINRYEDYMVNRVGQAAGLAEEVRRATGHDSVRVCADLFHMNIEEDDLADAITDTGPLIGHVHVDDSNRLQPGTGHLDFAAVFTALHTIGYDRWLGLECRLRGDPQMALTATTRFLRPFLEPAA